MCIKYFQNNASQENLVSIALMIDFLDFAFRQLEVSNLILCLILNTIFRPKRLRTKNRISVFVQTKNRVVKKYHLEYVSKNIMITAIKSSKSVTDNKKKKLRTEIEKLMKDFGITKHRLAELVF